MFLYMGGLKTTSRVNGTKHTMTELIVRDCQDVTRLTRGADLKSVMLE